MHKQNRISLIPALLSLFRARNTQKTSKLKTKEINLKVSGSYFYQFNNKPLAIARKTRYFSQYSAINTRLGRKNSVQ